MSTRMTPRLRPQQDVSRTWHWLNVNGVDTTKPAILAMRGYFQDSMGKPGVNDRGIYDDAFFVVSPREHRSFFGNTDPTRHKHGVAMIMPGVHPYRRAYHKWGKAGGHPAFRPATPGEELPVWRDGIEDPRPGIACNMHRGGWTTTSSEGCLTIHPDHWQEFYDMVDRLMDEYDLKTIPVCLIEQQG